MDELIKNLAKNHKQAFSHSKPYLLSVQEHMIQQHRRQKPNLPTSKSSFPSSMHNAFIVLPPSEGMARSGPRSQIQFGNADTIWIQEKKTEREERQKRNEARQEPGEETGYPPEEDETYSNSSEGYCEDEDEHSDSSADHSDDIFMTVSCMKLLTDALCSVMST